MRYALDAATANRVGRIASASCSVASLHLRMRLAKRLTLTMVGAWFPRISNRLGAKCNIGFSCAAPDAITSKTVRFRKHAEATVGSRQLLEPHGSLVLRIA